MEQALINWYTRNYLSRSEQRINYIETALIPAFYGDIKGCKYTNNVIDTFHKLYKEGKIK